MKKAKRPLIAVADFPNEIEAAKKYNRPPRPPELMYPLWLLTCNRACCRRRREDMGLERRVLPEPDKEKKER